MTGNQARQQRALACAAASGCAFSLGLGDRRLEQAAVAESSAAAKTRQLHCVCGIVLNTMTYRPTFLAVLLVGASILACSSQDGDSPSAPCAHRHDYYYKRYSSSSCFPLWEGTTGRIEVDNQRTEPEDLSSECAGSITYSADNCVETQEITCQEADGPSTSREVIYWSADGRHGTFAAEGDGCSFQGTFAKFGTSEACAALAQEIAARAAGDQWLIDMGRQADPCADPVAVTNTDYRPACAQLDQCLCEAGQKQHC